MGLATHELLCNEAIHSLLQTMISLIPLDPTMQGENILSFKISQLNLEYPPSTQTLDQQL